MRLAGERKRINGKRGNRVMEEIAGRILEAVETAVGPECEVQFQEVEKNNGVLRRAVVIKGPGMNAGPVVYIDSILKMLGNDEISLPDAAAEIAGVYKGSRDTEEYLYAAESLSREKVLEKVVYQLVNKEKNEGKLAGMPYKELLDLAAVYRVIVDGYGSGTASFAVSSKFCTAYGISREELDAAAGRNTEKMGFCIMPMDALLKETAWEEEDGGRESKMFVLTNTEGCNGAAVMLYGRYFGRLAGKLGSDLYVLPSSIHEVIAIPVDFGGPAALREMVSEINDREVADEEVLSGNVYRYSRKTGRLTIA